MPSPARPTSSTLIGTTEEIYDKLVAPNEAGAEYVILSVVGPGKRLSLMRATDVSAGVAQPEEFKVTLNGNSYMMAEEQLTLGVASSYYENGVVV